MAGLRLTKAERELIKFWMNAVDDPCQSAKDRATAQSVLTKLEASELPVKKAAGVTIEDALTAFHGVLGGRLVRPPYSAQGVLGAMRRRMDQLNLTRGDYVTIAKVAAAEWKGPVRAESLIRQADVLLAAAQRHIKWEPKPTQPATSPTELGDDEI